MTDTKHTDSVEAYIKVTLDYAPKENGEEFDKWCEKYGFTPLNSGRRAWSSGYGTYFRDALGIACTESGETFIFDQSDVDTFTTLQATQSKDLEIQYNAGFRAGYEQCVKNQSQQVEEAVRKRITEIMCSSGFAIGYYDKGVFVEYPMYEAVEIALNYPPKKDVHELQP